MASGRFVLRLPPALHSALQATARDAGLSLNEYCTRRLAAPGATLAVDADTSALVHDVAEVLAAERDRLPPALASELERLADVSRRLRRDRELAFYGAEDLAPSDFHHKSNAEDARRGARFVVRTVRPHVR